MIGGMKLALSPTTNRYPGGFMAHPFKTSDTSSVEIQDRQTSSMFAANEEVAADGTKDAVITPPVDRALALKVPLASAWNEALCCEARNSLQVILSGAEILLEDHLGNLLTGQKDLLTKMTDNAYQLSKLMSALLGPDEFKLEDTNEGRFKAARRVPAKV
jgi:hypothetical protein